jgi:hypothetical protein
MYRVEGLPIEEFAYLFGLGEEELAERDIVRMVASSKPGAPCRITLEDAEPGETLLLLNHVSHDVSGPYRASHAIFVREAAEIAGVFIDELPPVFAPRILSLRGFDSEGMMVDALLTQPGEAEAGIAKLFEQDAIAYIHAHNAIRGCFSARIDRN